MSRVPEFQLHPAAAQDITDIWEYIATDNPAAAIRFTTHLFETMRRLALFPDQGHLSSRPLRYHTFREHLIAYAPDEEPLLVIAVLHGRRNPRVLAAMLRNRT